MLHLGIVEGGTNGCHTVLLLANKLVCLFVCVLLVFCVHSFTSGRHAPPNFGGHGWEARKVLFDNYKCKTKIL